MPIPVQCGECKKQYAAPDRMAGKRVKCKYCGGIFEVPSLTPAMAEPDLSEDSLAALEGGVQVNQLGPPGSLNNPFMASRMDRTDDVDPFTLAGETATVASARANTPLRFPQAELVDSFAPALLLLIGALLLVPMTLSTNASEIGWIGWSRLGLYLLIYALIVTPITLIGIKTAGQKLRYEMPPRAGWRAFATFFPAFAMAALLWIAGGTFVALLLGAVIGLLISGAAYWLTFRLRQNEFGPSIAYTGAAFVCSVVLAGLLLFGLNVLVHSILESTQKLDVVAASPVGEHFAWDRPAPEPPRAKPDRPPVLVETPPTDVEPLVQETPPEPDTGAPLVSNPPVPEPIAPEPRPVFEDPTANPPPVAVAPDTTDDPVVQPVPAPTDKRPSLTPGERLAASSPYIASATVAPLTGVDEVIYPLTGTGNHFALIQTDSGGEDQIELWTRNPLERQGVARFAREPGARARYHLSPDGRYLARIATFPIVGAQIWNFPESRLLKPIELNSSMGTLEILGFLNDTTLAIRYENGARTGAGIFDLQTERKREMELIPHTYTPGNVAVSADGKLLAITARVQDDTYLFLYNTTTGKFWKRLPIKIDSRWALTPAGITFSPDNEKVAVAFSMNNQGMIFVWAVNTGKLVGDFIYPAGFGFGDRIAMPARAFDWLPSNLFLAFGRTLYDDATGAYVADLGIDDVVTQRVIDADSIEFVTQARDAQDRQLVVADLDTDKLASRRKEMAPPIPSVRR